MMASAVAASMPLITLMPIDCRLAESAPVEIASGSTPRMKATQVMVTRFAFIVVVTFPGGTAGRYPGSDPATVKRDRST